MHTKRHLALVFGGRSAEHDISLLSARHVIDAIDRERYDLVLIGMNKQGQMFLQETWPTNPHLQPEKLTMTQHLNDMVTFVRGQHHALLVSVMTKEVMHSLDVVFPVLHGPFGEDGIIQGLCRFADVPFVGSDVLGSAICMDKDISKRILRDAGLPVVPFVTLYRQDASSIDTHAIIKKLGLPCFVKPANMGSSIGIVKVNQADDLKKAIDTSLLYDHKVIVEQAIVGRELECAVLGNRELKSTPPAEITTTHEFYTYEAKYFDPEGSTTYAQADVSKAIATEIQDLAKQAFKVLECAGMARVDFFLDKNNKLYINELNTIPGFTQISLYPKMWETAGLNSRQLVDTLVDLALEHFDSQAGLLVAPKE